MSKLGRYTVLFSDGLHNGGYLPDAPSAENTVDSLEAAADLFRRWVRDSGNDYGRAEGYGAPSAWIYPTEDYDGITYSDYPLAVFERGPRGGVARVSI